MNDKIIVREIIFENKDNIKKLNTEYELIDFLKNIGIEFQDLTEDELDYIDILAFKIKYNYINKKIN